MIDKIEKVAIIGAGTMGSDIALLFAIHNYDVVVCDISQDVLDNLFEKLRITLDQLYKRKIAKKYYKLLKKKITFTTEIEEVKDVDFVHENIDEKLEEKRKIFQKLGQQLPDVVLATDTSSLKVSDIAEGLQASDRIVLMHYSNPPITSDLAEIMKGKDTSEEILRIVTELAKNIGRTPVIVGKDMNGAVMNRVLSTINNEGLWALQNDEGTKEEIDAAFYRIGNFNLGLTGTIDLVGIDIALDVGINLARAYGKRFGPPIRLVVNKVKEGRLGKKTGLGFNDWSKGNPIVDKNVRGKYDENRILAVAANEIFWMLEDEISDIKEIDQILKLGFRLDQGLCEKIDSIGLDKLFNILNELHSKYKLDLYKPCSFFEDYIKKGWTGKKSGKGFYTYPL
ncbi:MAG: 3-hydroxyacyl-CoA dehydrogenase [Promethearchaeota archaeon]